MRTLTLLMALMLGLLTVPGEENSSLAKKNGYVINLDRAEKLEKMTYSSLFSKAGIIVLEDTDESLLGKVDKLEVCDNNLYVLEKGRGLFLFNKQGKFIKMIGRKGKGPGEYIDPDDISIDRENKKIYVLDSQTQNVLKYSGNGTFESSFKLENKGTRSTFIQPFKNALYTNLYTFDKSGKRFLLSKVDVTNGKRISFQFEASQYNKGWNELFSTNQHTFISGPTGNPKFMQIFMDTIFEITPKGIKPYITLQSKKLVTKEYLETLIAENDMSKSARVSKIYDRLMKSGKIYNVFDYWETAKYIHFGYHVGHYGYSILYKKEENKAYVMSGITDDLLYTDKAGTLLIPNLYSFDENRVYCIGMNDSFTKDIFLENMKKGGINPRIEGADKLQTLTEDSNPIIIYYEFKK